MPFGTIPESGRRHGLSRRFPVESRIVRCQVCLATSSASCFGLSSSSHAGSRRLTASWRFVTRLLKLSRVQLRSFLALILVLASLVPTHTVARAASEPRFGIDEGYKAPDAFQKSGATWDRVNFFWNSYQPNGPTDWFNNANSSDADIARDLASGIAVVGVITNPPAWATRNGSTPSTLALSATDPNNFWAAFIHHLASDYNGRINDWIIWNEPDVAPNQPGSSWAGDEYEFYQLTKEANQAIRAVNPRARIIFAGTTYWSDVLSGRSLFLDRVLQAAARDPDAVANGYFIDAVDIHIYSSPYQVYTIPQTYRGILKKYGVDKPIWISEMNIVPWNDPMSTVPHGGFRATLDEQASYMIQAIAMARAAGVERAAVYKMSDGKIIGGEPFGLVRDDGSVRPAYTAFQVAMQYLNGPGDVTYATQGNATVVTIVNDTRVVTVAWNMTPGPINVSLAPRGTTAGFVTKLGQLTGLTLPAIPSQPNYVFTLADATANTDDKNPRDYVVGGEPIILVEDGVGQAVQVNPTTLFYPSTGFLITGAFYDYFTHRGGLRTFGYPISRQFPFMGSTVQFFQRRVLQLNANGTVGQLNLLDAGYMPYSEINSATFPPIDDTLVKTLPAPGSKDYVTQIMRYVQTTTPDSWDGIQVNFEKTFTTTVSIMDAFPTGKPQPSLLPGINLELWGVPTSGPAIDPNNNNFVYQRFQRGIMHYDKTTGVTQGLLLADYFKSVITGQNIPPDLDAAARVSPFYRQYATTQPHWLNRPDALPGTDLTFAFERQSTGG